MAPRANDSRQRKPRRGSSHKENRDGNHFLVIPDVVLKSRAFRSLGYAARSLLFDIASQLNGNNNGKLVACKSFLLPLGWTSADTVTRCRKDLERVGLLIETRKGACPNLAAWYAVPWTDLDPIQGLEISYESFKREKLKYRQMPAPTIGAVQKPIAPRIGTQHSRTAPTIGAIEAKLPPP